MLSLNPFEKSSQSDIDSDLRRSEAFIRSYLGSRAFETHQQLHGELPAKKLLAERWSLLDFRIQYPDLHIEDHLEGQLFGMKGVLTCVK